MDDYLSTQHVAWVLGRSPGTVRDRIKEGEIEAIRIVGGFRVKAEVLRLARERIEVEAGRAVPDRELGRLVDELIATNAAEVSRA